MELDRINSLIDKYFDGSTSHDEEVEIATYLNSHQELTPEQQALKAMLGAFTQMRTTTSPVAIAPTRSRRSVWAQWIVSVSVAACAIAGIVVGAVNLPKTPTANEPIIICRVDGVLIDNQEQARAEMERILGGASGNIELAMARIEKITAFTSHE